MREEGTENVCRRRVTVNDVSHGVWGLIKLDHVGLNSARVLL